MIQYRYAKTEEGEEVDIYQLEIKQGKYKCIGCDNEMIAHFWDGKAHHFQHKADFSCSTETYLHKLAKTVFFDTFNECLTKGEPFNIEFTGYGQCEHYKKKYDMQCSNETLRKFNLLDFFSNISIEEIEGDFKPDIKLFNKKTNEQLFIEIKVTHESSYKKIGSEYRIIEIAINEENDIKCIRNRIICEEPGKIRFYNFKREFPEDCKGECKKVFNFIWLNNYGKVLFEEKNLKEIDETIKKESGKIFEYAILERDYYNNFKKYRNFIIDRFEDGYEVKNCLICENVRLNALQEDEELSWRLRGKSGMYVRCANFPDEKDKHCNYAVICKNFKFDYERVVR